MENQLGINKIQATAPDPSVDTLAHAFLPHRFVDHTHADSILVLTNQGGAGTGAVRSPGGRKSLFYLIKCRDFPWPWGCPRFMGKTRRPRPWWFWGTGSSPMDADARTAYETMIDYVTRAEEYIRRKNRGRGALPRRSEFMTTVTRPAWSRP